MKKSKTKLYSLKLVGKRFREQGIPLEIFEDLATLQTITTEMAKYTYLEQNPDQHHIPGNFGRGITFIAEDIREEDADPQIALYIEAMEPETHPGAGHYKQAGDQIVRAILVAEAEQNVLAYAPRRVLNLFNKFGRKLRADEYMEFEVWDGQKARFNREIRRRLIRAAFQRRKHPDDMMLREPAVAYRSGTFSAAEVALRGYISGIDQHTKTFQLLMPGDHKIAANYRDELLDDLKMAFLGYPDGQKVLLMGLGRFDRFSQLTALEVLDEVALLEDRDVAFRLEELSYLEDGWYNGEGTGLSGEALEWFSDVFEDRYDHNLPQPAVFPTLTGGIQLEWSCPPWEVSLEVDLPGKTAEYMQVNVETDEDHEEKLDLRSNADWIRLNHLLDSIFNV